MKNNRAARRYYHQVISSCPLTLRRRFAAEFKSSMVDYLEAHPDTTVEDIRRHFGEPQQVAFAFAAQNGMEDFQKKIRRNKALTITLIATLTVIALCVTALTVYIIYESSRGAVHSYSITVTGN